MTFRWKSVFQKLRRWFYVLSCFLCVPYSPIGRIPGLCRIVIKPLNPIFIESVQDNFRLTSQICLPENLLSFHRMNGIKSSRIFTGGQTDFHGIRQNRRLPDSFAYHSPITLRREKNRMDAGTVFSYNPNSEFRFVQRKPPEILPILHATRCFQKQTQLVKSHWNEP